MNPKSKFQDALNDDEIPRALDLVPNSLPPARQPKVVEKEVVVYQDNPNAIQRHDDGTMTYKRFTMTPTGMTIPKDVTGDEWNDVGSVIKTLESSISWVLGDWAEYANRVWQIPYADVAQAYGYEEETLMTYGWVCRSVPTSIRNRGVYFGHARLVAPLYETPELQQAWLQYAAALHLRVKDLKDEMGLLSVFSTEDSVNWLVHAATENKRLIEYPEFKPKPKIGGKKTPEKERVMTYRSYVDSAVDKIPYMDREAREAFIQRTSWLANYYSGLTEKAKKGGTE